MIFSEIYGKYYQAVAEMLRLASENRLTEKKLYEISGKAFSESVLSIPAAIQQKKWPLLGPGLSSILRNKPFTHTVRRWRRYRHWFASVFPR